LRMRELYTNALGYILECLMSPTAVAVSRISVTEQVLKECHAKELSAWSGAPNNQHTVARKDRRQNSFNEQHSYWIWPTVSSIVLGGGNRI